MLNVFITVDTEVVPRRGDLSRSAFLEDMRRDIYGVSREGEFGLRFQLDLLNEFGLKAVFFVESLFACAMGLDLLRDIVDTIQEGGHEVQLHLHTEWLEKMPHPTLRGRFSQHIRDFSEEEQTVLIAQGLPVQAREDAWLLPGDSIQGLVQVAQLNAVGHYQVGPQVRVGLHHPELRKPE